MPWIRFRWWVAQPSVAFIQAYPFWSLALFTLDILIIYGLIAHGTRSSLA